MTDATLKKPFEDVPSVTEEGLNILENPKAKIVIGILTNELRRARLYSNNESMQAAWRRMKDVQVGDLVLITDVFMRQNTTDDDLSQGIGYLIALRDEFAYTDEEWEKQKQSDHSLTEEDRYLYVESDVYYIQYETNRYSRWVNSTAVKVDTSYAPIEGVSEIVSFTLEPNTTPKNPE